MPTEPCKICQSPVRTEKRREPRRLGQAVASETLARVCTSPACPSNTGTRKMGQTV